MQRLHITPIDDRRTALKLRESQEGMIAIVVTMIFMSLLTLVTIGFSRLMLREQRQAIDRQLSTQAFYAAESGINDAIRSGIPAKTDCTELPNPLGGNFDHNLSAADDIAYSCVTVESGGGDVVFDSVSTEASTTFPINTNNINTLQFSWEDPSGSSNFVTAASSFTFPRFPSMVDWGDTTGVLRVTIMPIPFGGNTRDAIKNLSRTYFLYPSGNPADLPITATYLPNGDIAPGYFSAAPNDENSSGQVISGRCSSVGTPRKCNASITNLVSSNAERYVIRIKGIYKGVRVAIQGSDLSGAATSVPGAQYVIDSTGRSNDVLKRIQVRVPMASNYAWPEFSLESAQSICKQLMVAPGFADNSACRETNPVNMNVDPRGLD